MENINIAFEYFFKTNKNIAKAFLLCVNTCHEFFQTFAFFNYAERNSISSSGSDLYRLFYTQLCCFENYDWQMLLAKRIPLTMFVLFKVLP